MKVFLSWSGLRSHRIALELREWLPNVVQAAEPWMSATDIEAGRRWGPDIASALEESRFGILCITPENVAAPWLLFEAGALAKTVEETYVCPYLIGMQPADLPEGPLTQFQASRADADGTRRIVASMSAALRGAAIEPARLDRAFEKWWPDLQRTIDMVPTLSESPAPRDPLDAIPEILNVVRQLDRTIRRTATARTAQGVVHLIEVMGPPENTERFRERLASQGTVVGFTPPEESKTKIYFATTPILELEEVERMAKEEGCSLLSYGFGR
ncbi:MAG: toll/interleukin-1 receptor domain-containing protein [Candidatus Eisenbacteria bacterium]